MGLPSPPPCSRQPRQVSLGPALVSFGDGAGHVFTFASFFFALKGRDLSGASWGLAAALLLRSELRAALWWVESHSLVWPWPGL